jgi:2,4-dienoyl-CoA reductase-like NADH-dependent reductase (Old Yellow Enzyme family)
MQTLFEPITIGAIHAPNRILMAPMTRGRVRSSLLHNPDLPNRFARDRQLNEPIVSTFYPLGPAGFTDYPAFAPA